MERVPNGMLYHSPLPCDFKVGDRVIFRNEYGATFTNTVVGFRPLNPEFLPDRFIYLNTTAYWFPHKLKELTHA